MITHIELIRALVVLASHQARAVPPGTRGLVPLDVEGQRFIAARWTDRVRTLDPPLPDNVRTYLEAAYALMMKELA